MGIGPEVPRKSSIQGETCRKEEPLRPLPCEDRAGKNQKAHSQGKKRNQSTLHAIPPNHGIQSMGRRRSSIVYRRPAAYVWYTQRGGSRNQTQLQRLNRLQKKSRVLWVVPSGTT